MNLSLKLQCGNTFLRSNYLFPTDVFKSCHNFTVTVRLQHKFVHIYCSATLCLNANFTAFPFDSHYGEMAFHNNRITPHSQSDTE